MGFFILKKTINTILIHNLFLTLTPNLILTLNITKSNFN